MNIYLEIFGYVASAIVAISLTMSSIVKLRWYNLLGASAFATYGFCIGAIPVGTLNSFIALVDIYYLIKIYSNNKEHFEILEICSGKNYHKRFIEHYKDDIKKYFPDYKCDYTLDGFYVLRDMIPAGLFLGKKVDENTFRIEIDYAVPAYRDLKLGRYVFKENTEFFNKNGFTKIIAKSHHKVHDKYLERMGFVKKENDYILNI